MKKFKYLFVCLILCMMMSVGCGQDDEELASGTGIYYLNTDGTGLVKEKYKITGDSTKDTINRIFEEMQKPTDSIDYISPFPENVKVEDWTLKSTMMNIYFNVNYNNMSAASKVLLRAAIIQTMTQVEGVEYVAFHAAGQPVTDESGKEIGYQNEEDFVQNIGSTLHSYQKRDLKLYFVNSDGDKLKTEKVNVRYNSNISVEKLVVEQLIDGPSKEGLQATFPTDTKVLGISVKDGVCYVNFDEHFRTAPIAVEPRLTIYSLVNSIVETGNVTKVQILINGEANVKYQDSIDLSQPFSRDLDITEEEE